MRLKQNAFHSGCDHHVPAIQVSGYTPWLNQNSRSRVTFFMLLCWGQPRRRGVVFRGFKTCEFNLRHGTESVLVVAPMLVVIVHYATVITSMR